MAANESTDPRVIADGLNARKLAKQREWAERAPQPRPTEAIQRAARAVLVAGIAPATKPQKDQQDTP
jgi:hypothetical protein